MQLLSDLDPSLDRVDVIGVPITSTNMSKVVTIFENSFSQLRGQYICVSNAHTCVMAHDDPDYWTVQASSAMSLPDGKPLSVIGRRVVPDMGRVTGPDLMREVFAVSGRYGWSHFFYGSDKETLDALRVSLSTSYPDMIIAGMEPSKFRPLTDDEMSELVAVFEDSGADFVWVGLGAPRQEQFCYDLKGKTSTVMIGVGGAFKVLSGLISEAPQWVQDLGMEWLFRLLKEPRRLFKRYLVTNTKFLFYHFTHAERRKGDL